LIALSLLLACSRSPAVPEGTRLVTVDDAGVHLVGGGEITTRVLESDPTQDVEQALVDVLAPAAGQPLWIEVPPDLPFWKLRRVLGSAAEAGVASSSFRIAGATEAVAVTRPDRYGLGFRCREVVPVSGVEPLVTLSIQSGLDGAWVVATATFLPVGPDGPVDGYPAECLAVPACGTVFPDPQLEAACAKGDGRRRVDLGGEWGCLLPIAKAPEQVSEWRRLLPGLVERLGLADRRLRVVMPEARVRADAVAAVLQGLADGGLPTSLGTESLVEGNDGPPVCMAVARDRAGVATAGAAWLGSLRVPPQVPASQGADSAGSDVE
jgi:hypothetical protein